VSVLNSQWLGRYDSLFVSPRGEDVALACPARLLSEAASGRRALVLALFEPAGVETSASHAVNELGAQYAAAGIPSARERGSPTLAPLGGDPRGEADQEAARQAARLLTDIGPKVQPLHVYAPLGLGSALDHLIAYEAALRAFASEAGRNLFLYEERPEAFVPGAVRTRLALLGARLPPGAAKLADQASVVRLLWRVGEPESLRGEEIPLGARLAARLETGAGTASRRPEPAPRPGPRLHPVVHVADEDARPARRPWRGAPAQGRQRAARARRSAQHARDALAKTLGGVYHAERLWLFLPAHDGLPEIQHPLEADDARGTPVIGALALVAASSAPWRRRRRPAQDRARARARGGRGVPRRGFGLTGEARYATHAGRHLRGWFVDEATRGCPHLRYAQAIQGRERPRRGDHRHASPRRGRTRDRGAPRRLWARARGACGARPLVR
jgi:hypothetical protein